MVGADGCAGATHDLIDLGLDGVVLVVQYFLGNLGQVPHAAQVVHPLGEVGQELGRGGMGKLKERQGARPALPGAELVVDGVQEGMKPARRGEARRAEIEGIVSDGDRTGRSEAEITRGCWEVANDSLLRDPRDVLRGRRGAQRVKDLGLAELAFEGVEPAVDPALGRAGGGGHDVELAKPRPRGIGSEPPQQVLPAPGPAHDRALILRRLAPRRGEEGARAALPPDWVERRGRRGQGRLPGARENAVAARHRVLVGRVLPLFQVDELVQELLRAIHGGANRRQGRGRALALVWFAGRERHFDFCREGGFEHPGWKSHPGREGGRQEGSEVN